MFNDDDKTAPVPHNNYNLWELASSGLIDEHNVTQNGKIQT